MPPYVSDHKNLARYLKIFLKLFKGESDVVKFAEFCSKELDRALDHGPRKYGPSRVEVCLPHWRRCACGSAPLLNPPLYFAQTLAVIARNPFQFSQPMSIPVFLSNGNHYLSGFDGSTTFFQLAECMSDALGLRPTHVTGCVVHLHLWASLRH